MKQATCIPSGEPCQPKSISNSASTLVDRKLCVINEASAISNLSFFLVWDLITNLIITQQQNKKKWNEFSLSSGILSLRNTWRLHLCKAKQYAVLFIAVKKRERHWMQTDICTPLWIHQLSCRAWKKWIHCYWSTRAKWAMLKRQYFFLLMETNPGLLYVIPEKLNIWYFFFPFSFFSLVTFQRVDGGLMSNGRWVSHESESHTHSTHLCAVSSKTSKKKSFTL